MCFSESVSIGAWVKVDDRAEVSYIVSRNGEEIEFSFDGRSNFELILAKEVLEQCVTTFPKALRDSEAAKAKIARENAAEDQSQ